MKLTKDLAELIGIIIGDGNIYYNLKIKKYYIEITGNINKEKEYYKHISNLFFKTIRKKGTIRISGRGLRIRVYSKKFVEFLVKDLEIHHNKNKFYNVKIPKKIIENNFLLYDCLRGIFDTDGSFFLAKKSHRKDYPCIEISTCSIELAKQIKTSLEKEFKLRLRGKKSRDYHTNYVLSLNGENETQKWFSKIGSSNKYKKEKYEKFLMSKALNNK